MSLISASDSRCTRLQNETPVESWIKNSLKTCETNRSSPVHKAESININKLEKW